MTVRRRDVLAGATLVLMGGSVARAGVIAGHLPWHPPSGPAGIPVAPPGSWLYFTTSEAAMVEALADRIIPPDPDTPGGKDAGCATFVDAQLAGPYGSSEGLYTRPPFLTGTLQQGPQSPQTPAQFYRAALRALEQHCHAGIDAKPWVALTASRQDEILQGLEQGNVQLEGINGKQFFDILLKDIQEGFFADPIYGGNRDMCGWRMIGFPGARYDYRDWVTRHNERYPYPPVSIAGRPEWTPGEVKAPPIDPKRS